jgi:hypothetical protein
MGLLIVRMKFLLQARDHTHVTWACLLQLEIIRSIEVLSHSISSYLEFLSWVEIGCESTSIVIII